MPGNYFASAPNAFAGGQEFAAAQRERRRADNALTALIQRFGPEAANPGALASLQSTRQDAQMFPHQLGQAERSTAAQEALVEQQGALAGDPQAVATDAAMSTRQRTAMLGAARYLQATRKRGGDTGEAFGRVVPILSAIGMPTEQIEATREQILTNPDSLDELVTMLQGSASRALGAPIPVYDAQGNARLLQYLDDGTTRIIDGVSPAATVLGEQRVQQGNVRLGLQAREISLQEAKAAGFDATPGHQFFMAEDGTISARPIEGTTEERTAVTADKDAEDLRRDRIRGINSALGDARRVQQWGESALQLMNETWIGQNNMLSGQLRRTAANRPGTTTFSIAQQLDRIRGVSAIDELLRIKTRGGTLGQVTATELNLLKDKIATLSVESDPALLRRELAEIMQLYQRVMRESQGELNRLNTTPAVRPGGYGPPRPGSSSAPRARPPVDASVDDLLDYYDRQ